MYNRMYLHSRARHQSEVKTLPYGEIALKQSGSWQRDFLAYHFFSRVSVGWNREEKVFTMWGKSLGMLSCHFGLRGGTSRGGGGHGH